MQIKNGIQTVNYNNIFTHIEILKITNFEKIPSIMIVVWGFAKTTFGVQW